GKVFLASLSSVGLTFISAFQAPVLWIYGCLLAAGVARTFLWPASQAFLPQLVSRQNFPRAVTWNTGSFHLSSVIGPAAGGALIALTHSAAIVYGVHAASMFVCFSLIACVRNRPVILSSEPISLRSVVAGFDF